MRVELYGLVVEAPGVTFYLASPWRATALEHRLFEAVQAIPGVSVEQDAEERRAHLEDTKAWKLAVQAVARVLKGWQEEAGLGDERRTWRWLLDADVDANGYDHAGNPASLWAILRLSIDRGGPGEEEKGEDLDLEGFALQIHGSAE